MVYIVEDDKSIIRGLELFLKSSGMDYKSFESAEAFLAECAPKLNDVLVLDLNMPGMEGNDLLKILLEKNVQIPTIVMTAHDTEKSREACRKYGVKAYLRKPVDGEALIDIIKYNQRTQVTKQENIVNKDEHNK